MLDHLSFQRLKCKGRSSSSATQEKRRRKVKGRKKQGKEFKHFLFSRRSLQHKTLRNEGREESSLFLGRDTFSQVKEYTVINCRRERREVAREGKSQSRSVAFHEDSI